MDFKNLLFTVDSYDHGCTGRKYNSIREAVADGAYNAYNTAKIRRAFNFGRGTLQDLKRHAATNRAKLIEGTEFAPN